MPKWRLPGQMAAVHFLNTHAQGDVHKGFRFRRERERICVDLACFEMEEQVCSKSWVKPGACPGVLQPEASPGGAPCRVDVL